MIPYIRGIVSKQAHVEIPEGLCEEEYARNGFFGKYAHLYRSEAPVGWTNIEGNLKPRAYDLVKGTPVADDFIKGRTQYLYNDDVSLQFLRLEKPMNYYFRNADGDDVFFVHAGRGKMETDFGPLKYEPGDYIVVPRGTVYRLEPSEASQFFIIESFSEIAFPDKGMLGQHALFDPAVIKVPTPDLPQKKAGDYLLKIKRTGEVTTVHYPFCPINTVGWKGTLSVIQLNVRDIRPVSSDRYHLPPSAHTTFIAHNFVICSFLPRPLENGDPAAMKVPFYHSNIDFDEVLFYHQGEFFSRKGIGTGMITFHPLGIHHGPQKGAVDRTKDLKYTNEVAVMVDTKRPLRIATGADGAENKNYWKSWQEG